VRMVVDEEWRLMRDGGDSLRASLVLDGVFAALQAVEPKTRAATGFYDDCGSSTTPWTPAAIGSKRPAAGFPSRWQR
jgi:hypothetical protein